MAPLTQRQLWLLRRVDAHAARCPDCGGEPTVTGGEGGAPALVCPLHPDVAIEPRIAGGTR